MEGGSPQPSESWCCEVVQVAAGSRTKAEMTVMSCLPAHQRIAGLRDLGQCCPHPRREQRQNEKLGEGPTAASLLHEQTEEKTSTSLNGKDVCNSNSIGHTHLAVSVAGETVVPSVAARSPSATAGPFLALSLVGTAITYSPSTAAAQPARPVKLPSLPYPHRPSLTSQQTTDPPAAELQAASLDAVNQTETLGSAGVQTVEPPAALAADIEVAGSVSAGAALTQRGDPLSRMGAEGIPAAASETTSVELLLGEQRAARFPKEEHLEEWMLAGGKSSVAARTRKIATRTSPYPQHHSYMASPSLPAWPSQSGIVCDIAQRQQLSATPSKRQSWGKQQQALQRQEEGSQEEAADQQKRQPQEGGVGAKGLQGEHRSDVGDQEEKLKGDQPRHENLQPSPLLQREALQTKNAYTNVSVNGQVPCLAAETIVDDQLPAPQLSLPLALPVARVRSPQHRDGAFAEDPTTKEWVDKKLYDETQTDTLVVDAGTAVPSLPRRAASGETGNIAELAVARNQNSASPTYTCKAEKKTIQRDPAAIRVSAVGKRKDNGAATGRVYSVTSSLTTFARSNRKTVAGENSNSRDTNIHSCWLSGKCGERGCAVKVVSRGETKDSMGGKPRSSSKMRIVETKYSENWLSQSASAEHQVDRLVETGNTFFRSGERGERRRGNNYSSGVSSVCSSIDGVSPVRCSSQSTKDITGAGGALQWDTTAHHGEECHATVGRRSSTDKKEGNGGARSEQKHWHTYHSTCRCGDRGKARLSWVRSALLKTVLLLPRFAAAMRSRFGPRKCGPQRKGIEGDVAIHRGEVFLDNPRQKHKFPQLSTDGKYLQDMTEHKGDEGPAAAEMQKHLDNPAMKGAKERKTHTKDSRALLECCIPSAPASASMPLGLSRYVLLCVYTLQAFLTGCVYFGWPALSSMLYRSGAYAWLCSPSEVARASSGGGDPADPADASADSPSAASRLYLCNSQDAALAPLFTVCHVSDCVMCVVAGFLTDRCSPKGVCMFGQTLHVVGWTLLACSSMHFPAYVPAMVFIGCGCATAYLPLLRVALLFPRSKATTIAILGAANTGSFAVPCILDAIWRRAGVRPNAAAAVAALASAAVVRGASTVSSGEGSTEGASAALHGGSGGGRGWTFTDICLLYLGVGPLCCMLLAAFFLPAHRFSVVAQNQNAWKQKPHSEEKAARQEQRKRWRIMLAPGAAPPSGRATGSGSDSLGLSTKTDTEEEGSSTSSQAPTWKLWNVCRHNKKGKQQTVHLQRQQKGGQSHKSRRFRSPFYRHRQHEDDREPWQLYYLRELQCSEPRAQRQRERGTGKGSQLQVGEAMKHCASEEASYESTEFRVSVSEDQGMSLQQNEENHRSNACTDGLVEGGTQQPLEDKWQGKPRRGCEYGTDLPMVKRHAHGAEWLEKIKGETCARFATIAKEKQKAASAAQVEKPALGVRLSPRETREAGGGSKWRRASRGSPRTAFRTAKIKTHCCVLSKVKVSTKETHFLRNFFPCKKQKRRAAANRQEVAKQTQNNCVSSEILSRPPLTALPSLQTSAALTQPRRLLPQEGATLTTTQTGMRRARFVDPADANKGRTTGRTEIPLHSEERDCTSAPESDVETGKHYGKEGADAVCCERRPSAAGSRRTGNTNGAPKEKRITERGEATEGHQRRWWGWCKVPSYDLCRSLVTTRQLAPHEKGGGNEDDREGTEESNKGTEGRFCYATDLNSVDENCPQTGFAEHHPQQDAHSEDSSRFVASLYIPDQASAYGGAFRQSGFASNPAARQGTSTTGSAAAPQTVSGADHFSSARAHPSNKHCVTPLQQLPDNRGPTTVAQAFVAAAAESLRATAAPEETADVVSKEAPLRGTLDAQTATARVAATGPVFPGEKTAVCSAAELPGSGCSACVDCTDECATRTAATVLFAASGPKEAGTGFVRETTDACRLFAGTGPADRSVGSDLPCVELPKKKATFFSQCLSVHFACLVFYSGVVSVALSFMQSSASRLFSARVLTFMDWALPFSFIPCILLGRAMDMVGPFPVLLFMNSMGLLSYLCAASTPLEGVHYLSVLAFCVYVSLDSEQVYCYVEYTFRPEHFGRLSGLLMAIDGTISLVSIPLYDNLTVRNLGGNPLPVAFGISGLLGAAYLLLTGLWLHRRKYPDPFGLLDENSAGTGPACSRYGAIQREEEQAEVGALKANKEDREPTDAGMAPPAINSRRDPAAAMGESGEAAEGRTDEEEPTQNEQTQKRYQEVITLQKHTQVRERLLGSGTA